MTGTSVSTGASLSERIASVPQSHDNNNPLWKGPSGEGLLGGITQSMLVRFMSCRERFRLKYVLGLEPSDKWNKNTGYGNMWHFCEEIFAKDNQQVMIRLGNYVEEQMSKYPLQREEIDKWHNVCRVQFPEYIAYWKEHPDVKVRQPLMQEQIFDVNYPLPSGRVVRLRGKMDSVDAITDEITGPAGGIYLQEDKTKGDIDKIQVERQLKFDLQTMMYLACLSLYQNTEEGGKKLFGKIKGVRYNVVRRPLSGGVGSIRPHAAKATKTKVTPAETAEEFYERLRRDYIHADPAHWFFRVRSEVNRNDIDIFLKTCLDPLLEQLCWWYDQITEREIEDAFYHRQKVLNYRTPFGVWSALEEGGSTEYDAYLETGSEAGLRRVESLFPEL